MSPRPSWRADQSIVDDAIPFYRICGNLRDARHHAASSETRGHMVAAKKTAAKAAQPEVRAEADASQDAAGTLRLKDLIERVTAASGAKKKDVREISEAVLKVLGDALDAGDALQLPPLGKAKVARHKDTGKGEMLVIRLKRGGDQGARSPAAEPLAEPAE